MAQLLNLTHMERNYLRDWIGRLDKKQAPNKTVASDQFPAQRLYKKKIANFYTKGLA